MADSPTEPAKVQELPRKERTRQRLIDAALEILRSEGEASVTTVRVTRAAGIVQSGFYKHFKSIDDCLEAAADTVLDQLREMLGELRHGLPKGAIDPAALAANSEKDLQLFLSEPRILQLLLRARAKHSILGRSVDRFVQRLTEDLTRDLWLFARRQRLPANDYPRVALFAELVVAQYLQSLDAVASDRHRDVRLVAQVLSLSIAHAAKAIMQVDDGDRPREPRSR